MSRQWQAFVERALCFHDNGQLYYGVCFMDKHGRVQYTHGCFRGDDVTIGNDRDSPRPPLDTAQFRLAFDQHSRITMQDAVSTHSSADDTHNNNTARSLDAATSIRLGSVSFQIVSTSYTSLCAVASGKRYGLVAQRLPFGIFVVTCRYPQTVGDLAAVVERCCRALR